MLEGKEEATEAGEEALVAAALREFFASDAPLVQAEDAAAFRAQMLRDDNDCDSGTAPPDAASVLSSLPPAGYADQLAAVLALWRRTERCPAHLLPAAVDGVAETQSSLETLMCVSLDLVIAFADGLRHAEGASARVAICAAFIELIGGARGILTLLGFRETTGSRNVCPLTRAQCVTAFSAQHKKASLTVGARAFSKHCERSADGWWGQLRGNDEAKNRVARQKLEEILDGGVWKNVHSLPHAHVTMEVRNALGFGARWTVDDGSFRGFLEPQAENGHEMGWRH